MKGFKHWLTWQITCGKMLELMFCREKDRIEQLIAEMVKESGVSWHEIVLSYTYVEIDVQRWGSN